MIADLPEWAAYETLENDQVSVRDRLRWLTRHPGGYTPQIYDQLAGAYRRAGHDEAARKVSVAKQRRRRSALSPAQLAAVSLHRLRLSDLAGRSLAGRTRRAGLVGIRPRLPRAHGPGDAEGARLPCPRLHPGRAVADRRPGKAWTPNGWAEYWTWSLIAVGWVLTTAAVAGLTGIFKRD
jgi:hypothetical protein